VVDAALAIVERDGSDGLSMRRLAEELGAAVTAIYWHVGNRDALVDHLVERLMAEMGTVHARGRSPRGRITSLTRELRQRLLARPHLVALADQRGLTPRLFQPVQSALADELRGLGLRGRRAARVIQVLQCHVVASVVLSRAVGRSTAQQSTERSVWDDAADPELVTALASAPDLDDAFALGLEALLDRLLPEPPR
jgi:AcrR family transcriptional regulator